MTDYDKFHQELHSAKYKAARANILKGVTIDDLVISLDDYPNTATNINMLRTIYCTCNCRKYRCKFCSLIVSLSIPEDNCLDWNCDCHVYPRDINEHNMDVPHIIVEKDYYTGFNDCGVNREYLIELDNRFDDMVK